MWLDSAATSSIVSGVSGALAGLGRDIARFPQSAKLRLEHWSLAGQASGMMPRLGADTRTAITVSAEPDGLTKIRGFRRNLACGKMAT